MILMLGMEMVLIHGCNCFVNNPCFPVGKILDFLAKVY